MPKSVGRGRYDGPPGRISPRVTMTGHHLKNHPCARDKPWQTWQTQGHKRILGDVGMFIFCFFLMKNLEWQISTISSLRRISNQLHPEKRLEKNLQSWTVSSGSDIGFPNFQATPRFEGIRHSCLSQLGQVERRSNPPVGLVKSTCLIFEILRAQLSSLFSLVQPTKNMGVSIVMGVPQ